MRQFVPLILLATTVAFAQPAYKPAAGRTLLRAGHVLDVHTGKETPDETIVVEGEKITAIAPTSDTPTKPVSGMTLKLKVWPKSGRFAPSQVICQM